MTRRQFLKSSRNAAIGAGVGLALPSIFLNKIKAATGQNPSEVVRVGFIATGGRGNDNMQVFLKKKCVAAICDVDQKNLAKAQARVEKEQGSKVPAYSDYRKLIEDKGVDAVLTSTPDHWHALTSIDAMLAGKDVYCEKPMSLTIEEGKVMRKVVQNTKKVFQTGSQQRSDPRFRTAVEMVRTGKLGKIHTVKVGIAKVNWDDRLKGTSEISGIPDSTPPPELDYEMWLGPAPFRPYNKLRVHYLFRFFWDYSGGQMTNWGAHHLDIAQWGLGMDASGPVEIDGKADYDSAKRFEVPIKQIITYTYANGVKINLEQGAKMGTTFIGDKGALHVNRGVLRYGPTDKEADMDDIPPMKDAELKLVYISDNHYENWLSCIKTRKLPICDIEVGHRTATVCHLGNISCRLQRKLKWDPVKEVIIGDAEAASMCGKAYRAPWKLPTV